MVEVIRQWLVRVLRAWLAALEGVEAEAVRVDATTGALAAAAREWVGRMATHQVSATSKRQIVVRALHKAFPGAKVWELNLALEQAVCDLKRKGAVRG